MHASRTDSGHGFCTSLAIIPRLSASTRNMVVISALILLLSACGGGGGGSPAPNFSGNAPGSTASSGSSGTGGTGGTGGSTTPPTPVYSIGNGSGAGFKDGVVDTSKTTLISGDTATLRTNVVDQFNNPPSIDLTVSFSSTCSSSGLGSFGTVTQVTRGLFSVDYTNKGCEKPEDVVTATLTQNFDQASVKIKMVGPDVLAVNFVSTTTSQLSLAGIGGSESAELTFKVAGPQGVPVVGKEVDFSINTKVGGATILSGRETGITDQAGLVRTVINSGTIAGPVNVKAVERSTGRQGISTDIVISTGIADANRFSMSTSVFNPNKAFDTDGIAVTLSIIASDIFGNNPIDGTRVSFVSPESGNIDNSCLLANGVCSVVWRSNSGQKPLNNRVTVLAYTAGAEHFTDNNGNSVYDTTDVLIAATSADTAEPYADENENNAYDLGEYFFDTNKNGVWDMANGKWDGPCLVKVDSRAVCTGEATAEIYKSLVLVMSTAGVRIKNQGTFPAVNSTITITAGTTVSYGGMVLQDSNTFADAGGGNPLPFGTTVTFLIEGGGVTLQGFTDYVVPSTTRPEGALPYGVTMVAAALNGSPAPTGVRLVMRVKIPDRDTFDFAWPITVQ